MMATVSVAVCTFNGSAFLERQLASLEAQTIFPDEIVISDDGSVDGTLEIIQTFAWRHPDSVRVIRRVKALGPQQNFAAAISHCTGDLIFLCDQDDIWLPEKMERMTKWLEDHPQLDGVFCNGWLVDEQENSLSETMWDALYFEQPLRDITRPENLLRYLLLNGNIMTGAATCFRRRAITKILPIPLVEGLWHDHWIALVLAAEAKLGFTNQTLMCYRVHDQQQVGFPGRHRSAPLFREAVHRSWLNDGQDTDGTISTHTAWALMAYEKYKPLLAPRMSHTAYLTATGQLLAESLRIAKTSWHRTLPWWARKKKLIKHWLKGGEYLRISLKDVASI